MKSISIKLLISVYLFLPLTLFSQVYSSCNIPDILFEYYDEDVSEIALQRIYNQNSTYMDSIEIPQLYKDSIWDGLAAIYNAYSIPERDSVFDAYCIHWEVPYHFTHYIYISISEDCPWYDNWQNSNINTGVSELDDLFETYGFEITYFSALLHYGMFITEQSLNLNPLMEIIETFDYINYVEAFYGDGDGDGIHYSINENGVEYAFKDGYDDCPSGCQSHWTYHFQVYNDCSVAYMGYTHAEESSFSQRPDPVYCNISTGFSNIQKNDQIEIYPNPTNGVFNINFRSTSLEESRFEIYNLVGEHIGVQSIVSSFTSFDISDQPDGIYFVQVINGTKNIRTYKILKRE